MDGKPKAIGLDRPAISGLDSPRRIAEMRCHAESLGYHYLYTVRPPESRDDPVGYALRIARGIHVAAVVVYDLATVDHQPGLVTAFCDLETVEPAETWAAACSASVNPAHRFPDLPLTTGMAHRIMQQHVVCRSTRCQRKAAAVSCLVRAGKLVPPAVSPRQRAAERRLSYPAAEGELRLPENVSIEQLLKILDAFADPEADPWEVAARVTKTNEATAAGAGKRAMCNIHHTEADGLRAEWKILEGRRIGIMLVRNISDGELIVRFPESGYPDLVIVRELWPAFEMLWNAVRHDYWAAALRS
ncbi:hypothetical protein AWN90_11525 [Nocardia terpenica]|uniref:Uncharacterized protein n=2 Tax=Nocardia terpenica TaxID=455432 RepID=A0A164HGF3_9NOCA|nr:hypothetical protein AWN90_11525 [Nocardia terpenica]